MAYNMFINGIPFLITYGRGVGLIMVEWILKMKRNISFKYNKVLQLYAWGCFTIQTILMVVEFKKVRDLVHMVNITISATNEHVGEVKRQIRTIKERCHGILGMLPFSHLPQQFIIGLVQFVTMWLNEFSSDTGIAGRWSPWELICWQWLDASKHCKTPCGIYLRFMTNMTHQIWWSNAHSLPLLKDPQEIFKANTILLSSN